MKKDNPVINGLQIEPGKVPERIEIKNELATFQELVGGHIEALMVSDRVCIIVNEEGILQTSSGIHALLQISQGM